MPKLFNILVAAISLLNAVLFATLGYQYVELGYGLHPWIATVLALVSIWATFHFITLVLDQTIAEQESACMKGVNGLGARRVAELQALRSK